MAEDSLEGTVRPRTKLSKKLWQIVKSTAPWKNMTSSELVEHILKEWIDEHVTYKVNGKEIRVKEVT